ncbi:metal-sensing transcriptional repressor [Heliobacillus mobilis]|uniref:Metal-sensing transcriptional repressor n=2 Tax=Heliobacterium TaxID=2697 RepID=A0A6I3SLD5_HELMO|nr:MULTISPECIES: metal-sensitive transcriptional regulator [Heliobacterium]MBC9785647.1 metal-sensitive transcriptional regulator [Heliobacterium chlorum]MTV49724.1 metal-sensing transcriptional repressor [Heliobacterium mobile]
MLDCTHSKEALIRRLKKIEGQIKGIQKMIADDKACLDLLVQVAAAKAAINRVGTLIIMNHSRKCLQNVPLSSDQEKALEELVDVLAKFTK